MNVPILDSKETNKLMIVWSAKALNSHRLNGFICKNVFQRSPPQTHRSDPDAVQDQSRTFLKGVLEVK